MRVSVMPGQGDSELSEMLALALRYISLKCHCKNLLKTGEGLCVEAQLCAPAHTAARPIILRAPYWQSFSGRDGHTEEMRVGGGC